jgi:hypothetical protein
MDSTNTTSTTPSAETPRRTVAEQIDAMLVGRVNDKPAVPISIRESGGDARLTFNSATRQVTAEGDVSRLTDGPITTTSAHEQRAVFEKIGTDYQRVVTKLNDHSFTPTGEKVYAYPEGSDERRRLLLQAGQYQTAGATVQETIAKLERQDADSAALAEKQNAERNALRAFSGGDPTRAAIFNEELTRAEAAEAARLVIESRKAK